MRGRFFFVLMMAVCISISCFVLCVRSLSESNWKRATGFIEKVEKHATDTGESLYVTYSYKVGASKFQSTEDFGNPKSVMNSPKEGDSLDITYNPNDPKVSQVGGSKNMLLAFVFGLIGLASLATVPFMWTVVKGKL